jgi:hypothetical protein
MGRAGPRVVGRVGPEEGGELVELIKRLCRRLRKPQYHYHLTVTNPSVDLRQEFARMERIESRWR